MLINALTGSGGQDRSLDAKLSALVKQDALKVLVTDSGLGGLSVCAAIDSLARTSGRYRELQVVFANALPDSGSGYNRMKSLDQKVRVFDAALRGMVEAYAPDLVLIACNTLSVVYPFTPFAQEAHVPVVGIVSMGVEAIMEQMREAPAATVIVFGTETTIASRAHTTLLLERGIAQEQIVLQACPELAGAIEREAGGNEVKERIERFVGEAVRKAATSGDKVVAGLCCTHYGFCADIFRSALLAQTEGNVVVVDPNVRMSRLLFPEDGRVAHSAPEVRVHVVSRAVITPEEIRSIGALLMPVSRPAAAALQGYELKRDLFPYTPE
jgi:glutamate racemase